MASNGQGKSGLKSPSASRGFPSIAAQDYARSMNEPDAFAQESTRIISRNADPITASACLVITQGAEMARRYRIRKDTTTIGRSTQSDIQLLTGGVSRSHARIEYHNNVYMLVDLNSTNGTWVNGHSIHAHPLANGDRLKIGETTLTFLLSDRLDHAYYDEIYRLTTTDDATGAFNQRYFFQNFEREVSRARRHQRALSLLVVNVDNFTELSKSIGYLGADAILVQLTNAIQLTCRQEDVIARFGNGEFYMLLPETNHAGAKRVCERLRELVQRRGFGSEDAETKISLSMGYAELDELDMPDPGAASRLDDSHHRLERLISLADARRVSMDQCGNTEDVSSDKPAL